MKMAKTFSGIGNTRSRSGFWTMVFATRQSVYIFECKKASRLMSLSLGYNLSCELMLCLR